MSLFKARPQEHLSLAKHLTAESKIEEFVAGKGVVTKWERMLRQNHGLMHYIMHAPPATLRSSAGRAAAPCPAARASRDLNSP